MTRRKFTRARYFCDLHLPVYVGVTNPPYYRRKGAVL